MKSVITAFSISVLCWVMRQTVYLCPTAEGAGGPCVLVSVCAHPCILKCLWMCDCVSVTKMRRRRRGLWRWLTQEIIWFQIQIGKKTWKLFKPYSQQQLLYQYVWFYKSGNIDIARVHANWCLVQNVFSNSMISSDLIYVVSIWCSDSRRMKGTSALIRAAKLAQFQ